ncbi:hypothetical protein M758_UG261900 [Ceratodon purpureus]|nr:hypothetical protein M758_UG261900 [Ceratodon purpureus]
MASQGDHMSGMGTKQVEDLCDGHRGEDKGLARLHMRGDYKRGNLEVWRDEASRRGNNYQFLIDASLNLSCLRQWLMEVHAFKEASRLEVPNHDAVWAQAYEGWPRTWKLKPLHQFQAVAQATGVMHPPRLRGPSAKPTPIVKLPR